MTDDKLKMILQVSAAQLVDDEVEATSVANALVNETIRFRDKLKSEAGIILTIEDTQIALDAFMAALDGEPLPAELTSEQMTLAQIYIDRMTLFKES